MTSVITVRIPDEMKRDLEKFGVEISKVTRSALAEEVRRAKLARAEEAAERLKASLSKVSEEQLLEMLREDRERR